MGFKEEYNKWLSDPVIDAATKAELNEIAGNEKEIEDRFYKDLEFGTAGLRGVIGAGTNRMNKYTVGKATQGLANFIKKQGESAKKRGVVIAYDSRKMSPEFAEYSALVFNANGIKAYVFDELKPVPVLSFAVRFLNATAGIAITASHNPPEYNGYKVYWEDGAQVSSPYDKLIMDEVNALCDLSEVSFADKAESVKSGLFNVIGEEIDAEYTKKVLEQVQDREALSKNANKIKIVYTPLHGAGNKPVRRVLKEAGFDNVFVVSAQEAPDGNFSTVDYPNPEDPKVFRLAIELAERENADVVVATDPDADRVGAVVKNEKGEYIIVTGNMSGTLLTHFILETKKKQGRLPNNAVVIETVVSTRMVKPICEEYGAELVEVLTGFKFIGAEMKKYEETGEKSYVFGFEESYGCLAGTYARDKDAVLATMLICELAAKLKAEGKTLYEGLLALYDKYGWYQEKVKSVNFSGASGAQKMAEIMNNLRERPPMEIGGLKVAALSDYGLSKKRVIETGDETEIRLPASNVLKFELEDGSWFCARPSGTEPKIKLYIGARADTEEGAEEKIRKIFKDVDLLAGE